MLPVEVSRPCTLKTGVSEDGKRRAPEHSYKSSSVDDPVPCAAQCTPVYCWKFFPGDITSARHSRGGRGFHKEQPGPERAQGSEGSDRGSAVPRERSFQKTAVRRYSIPLQNATASSQRSGPRHRSPRSPAGLPPPRLRRGRPAATPRCRRHRERPFPPRVRRETGPATAGPDGVCVCVWGGPRLPRASRPRGE